eukprot:9480604-Pyramimonas_sp.AAC.1
MLTFRAFSLAHPGTISSRVARTRIMKHHAAQQPETQTMTTVAGSDLHVALAVVQGAACSFFVSHLAQVI